MGKGTNSSLIKKQYELYLSRYAYQFEYLGDETVSEDLGIIITIPCYNEPEILTTLKSLYLCHPTKHSVEILILINQPEGSDPDVIEQNNKSYSEIKSWINSHNDNQKIFRVIRAGDLPEKYAGVGLARKLVMDEAIKRLARSGNYEGVLVGFDADSTCEKNYLTAIENFFLTHPKANGANLYFEHPIKTDYPDKIAIGIASYELHLRYMVHALRYAGFPYAFHTVGSSLAVRGTAYVKQGGMNRRKAGEDFYFLQKIIPLGNFGEINTTRIIPSSRESDRVPFGTGKAMMKWAKSRENVFKTYNPEIYKELSTLFSGISKLYESKESETIRYYEQLGPCFKEFINLEEWRQKLIQIQKESRSLKTFRYRFFQWMNGLKTLKFIHFARDKNYKNVPVVEAYQWLKNQIGLNDNNSYNVFEGLLELRNYDKENPKYFTTE